MPIDRLPDRAKSREPATPQLSLFAVPNIPLVQSGQDIAALIAGGLANADMHLQDGDIVVVAQKIISKAEGRMLALADIVPSAKAKELAERSGKDPRIVELILQESKEVLRVRPGLIVVAHRLGLVLANAGIDQSNVSPANEEQHVLLLPMDPDQSCETIRAELHQLCNARVGVVISDSIGRAWRLGSIGTALGVAGLAAVSDLRGRPDLFGRRMETSMVAVADEIAAAASLLIGEADEGRPVVVVRGLTHLIGSGTGLDLLRPVDQDLFR